MGRGFGVVARNISRLHLMQQALLFFLSRAWGGITRHKAWHQKQRSARPRKQVPQPSIRRALRFRPTDPDEQANPEQPESFNRKLIPPKKTRHSADPVHKTAASLPAPWNQRHAENSVRVMAFRVLGFGFELRVLAFGLQVL